MAKCEICNDSESKYTCPHCAAKYCSLKCFKSETHVARDASVVEKSAVEGESEKSELSVPETSDSHTDSPMIAALVQDDRFQYYLRSPALQLHLLSIVEILNNVSLTNEYSADGRREIASRKINDLRVGGFEANEWMDEFFNWLTEWIQTWKSKNDTVSKAAETQQAEDAASTSEASS